MERINIMVVTAMLVFISLPASGISNPEIEGNIFSEIPDVKVNSWEDKLWWESTSRDLNRNKIVDWLETIDDEYAIGVMYDHQPTKEDLILLEDLGITVKVNVDLVNGLLLGTVSSESFETISNFPPLDITLCTWVSAFLRKSTVCVKSIMCIEFFSPKIYCFIFGFHLNVLWPRCTPASNNCFMSTFGTFIFFRLIHHSNSNLMDR